MPNPMTTPTTNPPLSDAEALELAQRIHLDGCCMLPMDGMRLARFVIERLNAVKPIWKRSLKKGYAYCICENSNGAPFIVQQGWAFCPNCGRPLDWSKV